MRVCLSPLSLHLHYTLSVCTEDAIVYLYTILNWLTYSEYSTVQKRMLLVYSSLLINSKTFESIEVRAPTPNKGRTV